MRRSLTLTLVMGAALTVSVSATSISPSYGEMCPFPQSTATAPSSCPPRLPLIFRFDGEVTPKELPKHELASVAVKLEGKISTTDGTQASALREAKINFDRNAAVDAKGLPACGKSQLETPNDSTAERVCRASIVGGGTADVVLASSEQLIPLPLTLFNGGVRDGTTTLFIRSSIAAPTPVPIIATVKLSKAQKGRYGLQAVAKIPPIAGGSGSLLDFSLKIKRLFTYKGTQEGYAMARCFDGHLNANIISAIFRNEAKIPGVAPTTTLKSTLIRPCTPKG